MTRCEAFAWPRNRTSRARHVTLSDGSNPGPGDCAHGRVDVATLAWRHRPTSSWQHRTTEGPQEAPSRHCRLTQRVRMEARSCDPNGPTLTRVSGARLIN